MRMNLHSFSKLDPDPHSLKKLDLDPHKVNVDPKHCPTQNVSVFDVQKNNTSVIPVRHRYKFVKEREKVGMESSHEIQQVL
jgi:hypothetical protein